MAYVEERPGGSGAGMVIVAILVIVVLLLVAWMVFGGGGGAAGGNGDTNIDVNVPQAEAPKIDVPENVNVDVRSSGGSN